MKKLHVTLIQADLCWEEAGKNLEHFKDLMDTITGKSDLIIIPEMFTTGFTMEPEKLAETMDGPSVRWMKEQAEERECILTGTLVIRENNHCFNRLIWMPPDNKMTWYDKRHLFRMTGEHLHYRAGKRKVICNAESWRILPLVCYDLRFPVWSRNRNDYDLLLYVANWPESRRDIWTTLLRARAIENQAFAIGVNRIGTDGNGTTYAGDSIIFDPAGKTLLRMAAHEESVASATLSLDDLKTFRKRFPFYLDADDFEFRLASG